MAEKRHSNSFRIDLRRSLSVGLTCAEDIGLKSTMQDKIMTRQHIGRGSHNCGFIGLFDGKDIVLFFSPLAFFVFSPLASILWVEDKDLFLSHWILCDLPPPQKNFFHNLPKTYFDHPFN